jgi:hypothetical protein
MPNVIQMKSKNVYLFLEFGNYKIISQSEWYLTNERDFTEVF